MNKKPTNEKPLSGGARMKAANRHPVLLGLDPSQLELARKAAKLDGRPLTQFFIFHALAAGKIILEKSSN